MQFRYVHAPWRKSKFNKKTNEAMIQKPMKCIWINEV